MIRREDFGTGPLPDLAPRQKGKRSEIEAVA
jgi:hypothetical protein